MVVKLSVCYGLVTGSQGSGASVDCIDLFRVKDTYFMVIKAQAARPTPSVDRGLVVQNVLRAVTENMGKLPLVEVLLCGCDILHRVRRSAFPDF